MQIIRRLSFENHNLRVIYMFNKFYIYYKGRRMKKTFKTEMAAMKSISEHKFLKVH